MVMVTLCNKEHDFFSCGVDKNQKKMKLVKQITIELHTIRQCRKVLI